MVIVGAVFNVTVVEFVVVDTDKIYNIKWFRTGTLGCPGILDIDDLKEFAICEGEEINLAYSLNYVHKMCLTNKLVPNVELSFSATYPMRIKYDLENNSRIYFYLAPKLEE
mgnify:CR=1 FL=1